MAGTWSSYARLQALNPHGTFAISPDEPKARIPFSSPWEGLGTATYIHPSSTATDFTRTIPLSELMQADASRAAAALSRTRSATPNNLNATMSKTGSINGRMRHDQSLRATSALPLRVPAERRYQSSLEQVHAQRADRLVRLPKGWSQASAQQKQKRQEEQKEEKIAIYQPGVHEELVVSSAENSLPASRESGLHKRPAFVPSPFQDESLKNLGSVASEALTAALDPKVRESEKAALSKKKLKEFWLQVEDEKRRVQEKVKERMARNQKKDEENFHRMLAKLNENEELLHEINDYLSLHSQEDERRREALYQSWCEQIYEPIQNAIQQGLAERSTTSIEARRLKLFNDFLAISNKKKEGLYNDVIIEGDYNPLESRAYNLRISTKHLHDPLKASAEQLEEEWKLRASFHTGSDDTNPIHQRIKHQPKDSMLPPPIWAKYKIESTPHGRYSLLKGNIQKPVGKKLVPPSESYSQEFTTSNSLDQYNMIREDQIGSVVKSQFFPGGKRVDGYESMEKAPYDILASTRPSFKQMYGTGTKGQQSPQAAAAHNSNLSSPTRASFPTHANPLPPIHSPYSQQQQQQVRFVDSPINDE